MSFQHNESKALVVTLSSPEMDRLAVALAARRQLAGYVKRYVNKQRWWERTLTRAPLLGSAYMRTLGRRLPPEGLPSELVIEAGTLSDLLSGALGRVPGGAGGPGRALSKRFMSRCERSIAVEAARHAGGAGTVVASYGVALPAFRAARRAGARSVLNYPIAHHRFQWDYYREEAERCPEFASALPRFEWTREFAEQMDRECEEADRILVGSSFARDSFLSQGFDPARIASIPYGVDTARFRPPARPQEPRPGLRILYVGQIGQRKGIGYLLRAYRGFRKPDTSLILVGGFLPGSECYLPYSELFTHVADTPNAMLPDIYRAADVFVFPSLVEGMGLVFLEAMACGVPVIVSPNGPGDIVRDGIDGFVVPAGDSELLQEKLEFMYANPDVRLAMGIAARQQAERYSWSRYADAAIEVVLPGPDTRK